MPTKGDANVRRGTAPATRPLPLAQARHRTSTAAGRDLVVVGLCGSGPRRPARPPPSPQAANRQSPPAARFAPDVTASAAPFRSRMPCRASTTSCACCQRSVRSFARHCLTIRSSAVSAADGAPGRRRWITFEDRDDEVRAGFGGKRACAGDHLVQHGAEREDIRARVDAFAAYLLGRHVRQSAADGPRICCHGRVGARSRGAAGRAPGPARSPAA